MTTPLNPDRLPDEDRSRDDAAVADDRFVHGLLEFLHKDTGPARERRINAVLDHIIDDVAAPIPRHRRLFLKIVPLATVAVLSFALVTVFILPPHSTAYARVDQAIRATQLAPQLRYEIKISDPARHDGPQRTVGTIDMRGEYLLVRLETPDGHEFIMGRDREGEWSLRRDGGVERFDPRAAAPRWINLGESAILVGGLDALLHELNADAYSIERESPGKAFATAEGLTQLSATRCKGLTKPGPSRIQVWIDDTTSLVERLELRWDQRVQRDRRREPPAPRERASEHRRHRPPPGLIVFQRVDPVPLPDERFSPPQ